MHVNMEDDEKQRMEDFVRDLFTKTKDFNALTKKIVRKKYLRHCQKNSLNAQQKSIFADIIVKLLFEFNVGTEKSAKTNEEDNPITSPAALEDQSGVPEDNKDKPTDEGVSESAQETQPQPVLSSKVNCSKVEDETSLNARVAGHKLEEEEGEKKKDVESVEKKLGELAENPKNSVIQDVRKKNNVIQDVRNKNRVIQDVTKKNRVIQETTAKKRALFSLQPANRVLSRQILINNFKDKVQKNSPNKPALNKQSPSNNSSPVRVSEEPPTDLSAKLTNDKDDLNEEAALGQAASVNDHSAEKQQRAISKRLSAFEVLQSVLEDSNDGSVLSKSDLTDDDRASAARSSPVCDKEDSLIPLEEISDSTPIRRSCASKRLLESDSESMEGFTPPSKIKRIISSDSDYKNSPIRMRLFRNRIVDYSLHVPNAAEKRKSVIESDSESPSPAKFSRISDSPTGDSSSVLSLKPKGGSIRPKNKGSKSANSAKDDESEERKIVKPFRISISKKEILKASDSGSDIECSPVIKEKKTKQKQKRKKKSSKHKTSNNHLASSSSSCDTDDLKLSQIKSMNQKKPSDSSSDSDSELLINFTNNKLRNQTNNFKVPTVQENSIAADGLQPKLKIIHEKSAMDSDSDYSAKKLESSAPLNSNVGKLRIIRENAVDSENDCTKSKNLHNCDTAQLSSPEKTPQKPRKKSNPSRALNTDSDSDLGLMIALSTSSSDSEDVPLSKNRKASQTPIQSVSKSLGKSATGGEQEIAFETEKRSQKESSSPFSSSECVDVPWAVDDKNSINAAVAYIKSMNDTKMSRQQCRQESTANESSHVDVEDSSDESDNILFKTNKNKNAVYSDDDAHFGKHWQSKRLVIRLERIQATSSVILKPVPSNESYLFTTSSCRTTTSDDNAEETGHPEVDCIKISTDSDISSLSDLPPIDDHAPSITNHVAGVETEPKNVPPPPVESDKLKHLKKICRAAELFVNYKKEFQDLESDSAKCQRLQQILKDAGMKGRPTFKAAERIRLLREAKELNEANIISCDSGRPRRKTQDIFTIETSKNVIDSSKVERFTNLIGIVDSEGSDSEMEFN